MYTHKNYKEAMSQLKKNSRKKDASLIVWDAGDGYTAIAHYCPVRGCPVQWLEKEGFTIH